MMSATAAASLLGLAPTPFMACTVTSRISEAVKRFLAISASRRAPRIRPLATAMLSGLACWSTIIGFFSAVMTESRLGDVRYRNCLAGDGIIGFSRSVIAFRWHLERLMHKLVVLYN